MKRDRTVIWRRMLPLMAVALTLALSSCTKDPIGNLMAGGDGMEVRVTFPQSVTSKATTGDTETGTAEEDRLDHVTILIFNEDGSKLENVLSEDVSTSNSSLATSQPKWAAEQTLIVTPIANPNTPKKIYAIANWSETLFDKDTYTEAKLKEELKTITAVADINGTAAYPMLMSGSKAVANLTSLFYSVTVDMERQSSKIRANLSITTATQDLMPQIEWQLDLMRITVANTPNESYIVGRKALPATATLFNSVPIAVNDIKPAPGDQTIPATKDLKWSEGVYVNENPVVGALQANKDASTYIVVQLPYKNLISGTIEPDNYYKLYVKDTHDPASPYKVLRNTIYNLNISILGMGSPVNDLVPSVNIDVQLTVNSWEKGEIIEVEAPSNYFNIDRTTLGFQFLAESFQSTIATDVVDWKLVQEDGTTIFSFSEGKIAPVTVDGITYTLSGTYSAATVDVSKLETTAAFTTQNMFFEAKNLKVPFTVVSDNGWIPNSALLDTEWPEHLLPAAGGLQVATRGYGILPGGTPEASDPLMQSKTSNTETPDVELTYEFGLGVFGIGKRNTDAMTIPSQIGLHPAGAYCYAMGPEWYLPSARECRAIFYIKSLLGASYTFLPNSYSTSTQHSNTQHWYVPFTDGYPITHDKDIVYMVRCVR